MIFNPIFPLNEYVPDGEPHVFGDRVYLYGSHDKEGGDRFCMLDYTVWSAPVDDLSNWICHGTSYKKIQDKRATAEKTPDYYAPDCVCGKDGKYYLYYTAMGPNVPPFGPMSVAVSDSPAGPFEYLGDIRYPDGTPVLKYLTNDPAVINDKGSIWLYYGWGLGRDFRSKHLRPIYNIVLSKLLGRELAEIKATKPSILDCAVVELEDDMITVKREPKSVLYSKTTAPKDSQLYHHAFYEAPSIRKFGELYYLVYSSGENNELAYATSKYPDKDFLYRGVIISNSDLGFEGNRQPKNNAGTIHGGIESINGQYYVFYHRCTNNTDFSRQACAEPIDILPDGTIKQIEVTTQGLNGTPLKAEGIYPAAICCQLYNPKIKVQKGNGKTDAYPCVTFDGKNRIVHGMIADTKAVYKYFDLTEPKVLKIAARGEGCLLVQGIEIAVKAHTWDSYTVQVHGDQKTMLELEVISGNIELLELQFL
jgi:hypothetical protein